MSQARLNATTGKFGTDGFAFPISVLTAEMTSFYAKKFWSYVDANRSSYDKRFWGGRQIFADTHTFLPWVYRLATEPAILNTIQVVLGSGFVIWGSQWFCKLSGDALHVPWHQDAVYRAFAPPDAATAWIALTDSTHENGCTRMLPGTHRAKFQKEDLGTRVFAETAVEIVLHAGEMSVHAAGTVHESRPNLSPDPRVGLAVRYVSDRCVPSGGVPQMVMAAAGMKESPGFELIAPPVDDVLTTVNTVWEESIRRKAQNLRPPGAVL